MAVFQDAFARANESLEDSADWTRVDGAAGAAAIVSQQLSFTSTTNTAYRAPSTGSGDHYAQAEYVGDVAFSFPVAVRVFNSNNFIGFRWKDDASREVWKRVAGSFSPLLDEAGGASASEVYKLEWSGSTGKLYVDGGQLGSDMTASELSGNQSPGLIVRNNEGATLDNWESDVLSGSSTETGAGSSSGTSTVTGDARWTAKADGSVSGTSSVTADANATVLAAGSSAGLATATASASDVKTGDGSAAGTSTVTGDAVSRFQGDGSSTGVATVTGDMVADFPADGTSAGTSTASGDAVSTAKAAGSASGTVTVTADGTFTARKSVDGTSSGTCLVLGVSNVPIEGGGILMRRRRRM